MLCLILHAMKPVFKIGNSEELNSSQAVLLMEIGDSHCGFAIVDFANQMMVQLAYYTVDEKDSWDILQMVFERHAELKQTFRQTIIGYYFPESILIPSKIYRVEETKGLLQSLYGKGQNMLVTESVAGWQLYNAYYVPAQMHESLSLRFPTGNFWHVYSVILKNDIGPDERGKLVVDFKTDSFSVVVTRNNSLLLAQIFYYAKAGDVLYWLLKTCEQHSISRNDAQILLSGLIDRQSAVFKELYQYFLNIEFANIVNDIQLSGSFDDYPVHFFSSLYKLASCAS
ncbi:MAG TPA: DUF3822 family protein [Chitinophagaceae bacterium]|nr:DUF3822 family protein [Chitinophagaceae bacterium]